MVQLTFMLLAAILCLLSLCTEGVEIIDTQVIGNSINSCPSDERREAAKIDARNVINDFLLVNHIVPECGEGVWHQVGFLDMSNSEQSCPSPWVEDSSPARSCRSLNGGGCEAILFPVTGRSYTRVCGRATGFDISSNDAFNRDFSGISGTIDRPYVDGLSVTHGSPRQHVWTFAAGAPCPCRNPSSDTPLFVGSNYFCEDDRDGGQLWDGISCVSGCCTFNSPPWFSVSVPSPTFDDIEVRLCTDQDRNDEAVHISFYQFYIQ